jgi:Domain of unknown function (DUF1830)
MFDPHENSIPCNYRNEATTVQIVRISEPMFAYFERVVMPGQIVYFKATEDSMLEVYEANMASSAHVDTVPCKQLHSIGVSKHNLLKQEMQEITSRSHSFTKAA